MLALSAARVSFAQTELAPADAPQQKDPRQSTQRASTPSTASVDGLEGPATPAPLPGNSANADAAEPAAPAPGPPLEFGSRGQWLMMGNSNRLGISNTTYSSGSASSFSAGGELGLEHFVVDNVAVGIHVGASYRDRKGYGVTTLNETTSNSVFGGVSLGANAQLGESVSWFWQLKLGLESSHITTKSLASFKGEPLGPPVSSSSIGPLIDLYAPLLLHPASHFVVGFGPRVQHDFAVTRGGPYDGAQWTWISADFVVGGWWGGATSRERDAGAVSAPAKPQKPAPRAFGEAGQLVLTTATAAWLGHQSNSLSQGSETELNFLPSIDYFISNGVSIGAEIAIGHAGASGPDAWGTDTQSSSTSYGGAVRAGYNAKLSAVASIWLRAGFGYGSVDSSISSAAGTNQHTRTRGWIELSAPLLLHPVPHFFVGAGPALLRELDGRDQFNTEINATSLGAHLLLGGWFGSAGKG